MLAAKLLSVAVGSVVGAALAVSAITKYMNGRWT